MALSPDQHFVLEKPVWSEADLGRMGWHDVVIHGIAFDPGRFEFMLDIDYLFAWVNPEPPSKYYTFWAAPCTIVFRDVHNLHFNTGEPLGWQVMSLERNEPKPFNANYAPDKTEWTWIFDLLNGEIKFSSTGYTQYTRRIPVRIQQQLFSLDDRGGISFERITEPRQA
jgi:hypothetical protein